MLKLCCMIVVQRAVFGGAAICQRVGDCFIHTVPGPCAIKIREE